MGDSFLTTDRQSSFTYEEILTCSHGEMFGEGNAQLPLPPMLMVNRITNISETGGEHDKGVIRAEFDIHPDLWFFECHFPGDPVMPGCLGLDAMWQAVGYWLGWSGSYGKGRALGVGDVVLDMRFGHDRASCSQVLLDHAFVHIVDDLVGTGIYRSGKLPCVSA